MYKKEDLACNIPINLLFLRMFQLLCKNQSEEEVIDFIKNIINRKNVLFKASIRENDISPIFLFRNILRYLIDNKNIDIALEIFIIIINKDPYDIIGSLYFSEILIYYQKDINLLYKGIKILQNIKNYINFINLHLKNYNANTNIDSFVSERDKYIFSLEYLIKNKKKQNNIKNKDQNRSNKYDILIGFEQDNIENNFGIIYKYMKMNKYLYEDSCTNIINQNHILVITNN